MLIPAWTLVHEALFYLLFALAIWRIGVSRLVLLAWLVLFVGARVFDLDLGPSFIGDLGRTFVSSYNLLFLLGIGVAWIVERGPLPHARLLAVVGALSFFATGIAENARLLKDLSQNGMTLVLLYGLSSMLIITGLAAAERAGDVKPGHFASLLGPLSYPLYLTHGMTISIVVTLANWTHFGGPDWLLLLLATALACVVATVIHRWIEVPIARYLKRIHDRRRPHMTFASEPRPLP
jgi:peptidoglycan/LPS O-acetylase OafA/YrhL